MWDKAMEWREGWRQIVFRDSEGFVERLVGVDLMFYFWEWQRKEQVEFGNKLVWWEGFFLEL